MPFLIVLTNFIFKMVGAIQLVRVCRADIVVDKNLKACQSILITIDRMV